MKEKWIEEQQQFYTNEKIMLKHIFISHLKDAINWMEHDDFDTAYRMAGGVAEGLLRAERRGAL